MESAHQKWLNDDFDDDDDDYYYYTVPIFGVILMLKSYKILGCRGSTLPLIYC